jgi:hypothetical protein
MRAVLEQFNGLDFFVLWLFGALALGALLYAVWVRLAAGVERKIAAPARPSAGSENPPERTP